MAEPERRAQHDKNHRAATDIELVIIKSKHFEALLERDFGTTGRRLHKKITSVQRRLAEADIRKLRYLGSTPREDSRTTPSRRPTGRLEFSESTRGIR